MAVFKPGIGATFAGALTVSTGGAAITGAVTVTHTTASLGLTSSTGTNAVFHTFDNTGGNYIVGVDNSAGSLFGGEAYALTLSAANTRAHQFTSNGVVRAKITASAFTMNVAPIIATSAPPANAAATGVTGTVAWDSGFIYVATATNTWKRVAIATW